MTDTKISVIVPCLNERDFIAAMVSSVVNQTLDKNQLELIVIDGGSNDGTQQILWKLKEKYSFLKILHNPHRTTPYALNIGIKHSTGEFIARMDVHARYPENYLETLYNAAIKTGAANVGCCINTLPGNHTNKAKAIAYALSHPFGVGNSYFRIGSKHIREVDTVPFGFFRREIFEKIGLFDTDMARGQDDEFNARIKKANMKILLIPGERIRYYARENYQKLSQMMHQYGFFRPIANKKLGALTTIRQFIPLILVLSFTITAFFSLFSPVFVNLLMMLTVVYLTGCGIAAFHIVGKRTHRFSLQLWLQIILTFITSHFSYGFGYINGLLSLLTRQNLQHRPLNSSR